MKRVLVFAVHPDDETLGAGGALLRFKSEGKEIFWAVMTSMSPELGFSADRIEQRKKEIVTVHDHYKFSQRFEMNYPTTQLDTESLRQITGDVAKIIKDCAPDTVIIPHKYDAHSDHNVAFKALIGLSKTFRYPSIENVWAMETLSESNFALYGPQEVFLANTYVNISNFLEKKIEIMKCYDSEILPHPFPRSTQSIKALATLRGSESGFEHAEAFYSVKSILR